jgi:hypothetical protein
MGKIPLKRKKNGGMFPYRKKIKIKKYKNYQLIYAQYCRECSYKITKKMQNNIN